MKSEKFTLICPTCNGNRYYSSRESYLFCKKHAAQCKKCSNLQHANRIGNCKILLEETPLTYYWIGFILADGHVCNNRLVVTLAMKDENHLKKLAILLGVEAQSSKGGSQVRLACMDKTIFTQLVKKFDINCNKTKHPPSIQIFENMPRNLLLALFAGFIDGDGCINKLHKRQDFNLRIKNHASWREIVNFFSSNFLNNSPVIINNQGYSAVHYGNTAELKKLKKEVLLLNLPLLQRKWDVIDISYVGKYEKSRENIKLVEELLNKGMKRKDICKLINITSSGLSLMISRNNL